jgi:palmitoyltransferase
MCSSFVAIESYLICLKGMRTYDYILAMREENEAMELESLDDSDLSSDDSIDFDSPEKPTLMSRILCKGQVRIR